MEVPRDNQIRNVFHELEMKTTFSNEDTDIAVNTILNNSALLDSVDPNTLSRIRVKLLEVGIPNDNKAIDLIDGVFAKYTGKIDKLIDKLLKDTENEIFFLKQLSSIKEPTEINYLRGYEDRVTGHFDILLKENTYSQNLKELGSRSRYGMYDTPEDVTNLIFETQYRLEDKIEKLLTELKKDGVSTQNLSKGIELLKNLGDAMFNEDAGINVDKGISNIQKIPIYSKLYLILEGFKFHIAKFQADTNVNIVEIDKLAFLSEEGSELKKNKELFQSVEKEKRHLEVNAFSSYELEEMPFIRAKDTRGEEILREKFIENFSTYLSSQSKPQIITSQYPIQKGGSIDDLGDLTDNHILINGKQSYHPASEICYLTRENIDKNPVCAELIAKIISTEMFQDLLISVENQSKSHYKDLNIKMSEFNRFAEINIDQFDNLEISLKLMCGYAFTNNENVDEFVLAKRDYKIPLSDLKVILEENLELSSTNFEIVEFISPEVKGDEFQFHGANFHKLAGNLLEKFSPGKTDTIPLQYKKIMEKEIKLDPSLSNVLNDKNFVFYFSQACSIFGTQIDSFVVLNIARAWGDQYFRDIFQKLISSISSGQKTNLEILNSGLIPYLEMEHNMEMQGAMIENISFFASILDTNEANAMKRFFNYLTNHGFVVNSQIVEDSIGMEFHSENLNGGTIYRAQRQLEKLQTLGAEYDAKIEKLVLELDKENLNLSNDKILELHKEIADLRYLKDSLKNGYLEVKDYSFLVHNDWRPKISSNEKIGVVERVISFKTKEGKKIEGVTKLNLVGLVPVNPSIQEREQLSELIRKCEAFITRHSEFINDLNSNYEIPEEIALQLDSMNWIDPQNKKAVFEEIIRFTFDVNHKFIQNSLKI